MPFAKIKDVDCYYEIHGQGSPLALIAGLASDSQSWQPVLAELKSRFQVIVLDNRGAGRTKCPEVSFDIHTLAEDAIALFDYLGISKLNILGHSMGGYIAQEIAIHHPVRINKLILESSAAVTSGRNKFLFACMLKMLEEGISYESFLKEFFCWIFTSEYFNHKEKAAMALQQVLKYPYRQPLVGFRRQVEAIRGYDALKRLNTIQAETLVMAGQKDILITAEDTKILLEQMPQAKSVCVKQAAHAVHLENPAGFLSGVLAFL